MKADASLPLMGDKVILIHKLEKKDMKHSSH